MTRGTSNRFITTVADRLTLATIALSPCLDVRLGATPVTEFLVLLALAARGLELAAQRVDLAEVRHHGVILGVSSSVIGGSFLAALVTASPPSFLFFRAGITLFGSVALVALMSDGAAGRRRAITALAIGCTALAASGLLMPQVGGRSIGLTIHPNFLGHSCIMGVGLALFLHNEATGRARRFWAAAAVANVLAILASGSRGSTLALALLLLAYTIIGRHTRLAISVAAATWLAICLALGGVVDVPTESAAGRLLGTETSAGADAERSAALENDIRTVSEHPVFGLGFVPESILIHMVYFQAWVTGGALAGLAFILLGATMLSMPLWCDRRTLPLAASAAAIAFAWLFTNIYLTRDQWLFLVLVFRTVPSPLAQPRPARRPALGGLARVAH